MESEKCTFEWDRNKATSNYAKHSISFDEAKDVFREAHDDFLISVALCCEAIREFSAPVVEAEVIRPRRLYDDGRY